MIYIKLKGSLAKLPGERVSSDLIRWIEIRGLRFDEI